MNDTSPEMDARYRDMLMRRSGEERLKMGCAMRETARALVEASIREQDPQATPEAVRKSLFLRFYGHEFDAESCARFLLPSSLRAIPSAGSGPRLLFLVTHHSGVYLVCLLFRLSSSAHQINQINQTDRPAPPSLLTFYLSRLTPLPPVALFFNSSFII